MEAPEVSVITCFFNEENFLEEAIRSVMRQDYASWELILVDDGSTDRSTQIAKQYAGLHPDRIRYFHHAGHCNEGLSASRNLGVARARGQYIAFLDADDVWLPDKLSDQLEIFQRWPEVTVQVEASKYWRSWSLTGADDVVVAVGVCEGAYRPPALLTKLYPLGSGAAPCPSSIIARRDVFEGCSFEESFRGIFQLYEDQAFLGQVYLKETVYVSAACHNLYRQRRDSIVATVLNNGKYHMVRRYYLKWIRQYMWYHSLSSRKINAAIRRAERVYHAPTWHLLTVIAPKRIRAWLEKVIIRFKVLSFNRP